MRAVLCKQWGPPDALVIEDVPSPQPGPNEVLISVKACGLSFSDGLQIQGKYQIKPELPFSPGSEVSGIIKAVGSDTKGFKPGEAVFGRAKNGCAQEALADSSRLYHMPKGLEFKVAAGFAGNYGTSLYALRERAQLKAGETLLVLGASGGVGLAAIELGKMMGARVIACASTQEKLDTCKRMGADETINYETENLREAIKRLTLDKGVDVVLDPVGDKYAEPAVRSLGWEGRYLVVGFAAGDIPKIPLNLPLLKGASIVGVWVGAFNRSYPEKADRMLRELTELVAAGKLKPYVSATYPLERTADALKDIMSRKVQGKIVVTP